MTKSALLSESLDDILRQYKMSFSDKIYGDENNDIDVLMDVFGITPELKRENRQYWGRELGMCWQRLVVELFQHTRQDFAPAVRIGADEPYDCLVGNYAIDTKYRIGSGDSGTLKKFKSYASLLQQKGYEPVLLIVREDNLPAAMTACRSSGWNVYTGNLTFNYIEQLTNFDIRDFLRAKAANYRIER